MKDVLDFDRIRRNINSDMERIKAAVAKAKPLGIHVEDLEPRGRDLIRQLEELFGDRLTKGGKHEVTDEERRLEIRHTQSLFLLWTEMNRMFEHYVNYTERRAKFTECEQGLAERPAAVRIADGIESTEDLDDVVRHANNHHEVLAHCRHRFSEALRCIKARDESGFRNHMSWAEDFATNEEKLKGYLDGGQLVPVAA